MNAQNVLLCIYLNNIHYLDPYIYICVGGQCFFELIGSNEGPRVCLVVTTID